MTNPREVTVLTRMKWLLAGVVLTLTTAVSADDIDRLPNGAGLRYKAILPIESEHKWKRIPWMTHLDEAVKVAAKEKRPVCVWVVDNEPLDRC